MFDCVKIITYLNSKRHFVNFKTMYFSPFNLSSLLSAGKDVPRPESNAYLIFGCVKIIAYRAFCKFSEQVFNPFVIKWDYFIKSFFFLIKYCANLRSRCIYFFCGENQRPFQHHEAFSEHQGIKFSKAELLIYRFINYLKSHSILSPLTTYNNLTYVQHARNSSHYLNVVYRKRQTLCWENVATKVAGINFIKAINTAINKNKTSQFSKERRVTNNAPKND